MKHRMQFAKLIKVRLLWIIMLLVMLALPLSACQFFNLFNTSPSAVVEAAPTEGEAPLTISFDISGSSDSDGKITWFELYFGDCSPLLTGTDIGQPIRHTYQRPGTFEATLTVKDNSGATDEANVTITLEGPPPIETLTLGSGRVKVGNTWEIAVTLDSVPQGLAGYIMTVFLVREAVADIQEVTLVTPRGAGAVDIAPDKKSASFQAVDFGNDVLPGNSDITLARVAFKGLKKGTSTICAQIDRLDADGGADLLPVTKIEQGSLTVSR